MSSTKKLSSKVRPVALVTGSGHGVGKVIALCLAKAGYDIILCGRDKSKLETAVLEIQKLDVKVYQFALDATHEGEVKQLFTNVVKKIGRLDVLVNHIGGVRKFGDFLTLSGDDWREALNLNLMTTVYFSREAIPYLKKSKSPRIINISTIPARQPGAFNPNYAAAKAAGLNLSKYLANFLAKDGILVNSICPGTILGGSWDEKVSSKSVRSGLSLKVADAMLKEEETKKVPLGRICTPEDVASLVAFLASGKASFITGTCINLDGGVVRSIT